MLNWFWFHCLILFCSAGKVLVLATCAVWLTPICTLHASEPLKLQSGSDLSYHITVTYMHAWHCLYKIRHWRQHSNSTHSSSQNSVGLYSVKLYWCIIKLSLNTLLPTDPDLSCGWRQCYIEPWWWVEGATVTGGTTPLSIPQGVDHHLAREHQKI